MGAVYRVHSALTARLQAALKVLKTTSEPEARARFVREAESLSGAQPSRDRARDVVRRGPRPRPALPGHGARARRDAEDAAAARAADPGGRGHRVRAAGLRTRVRARVGDLPPRHQARERRALPRRLGQAGGLRHRHQRRRGHAHHRRPPGHAALPAAGDLPRRARERTGHRRLRRGADAVRGAHRRAALRGAAGPHARRRWRPPSARRSWTSSPSTSATRSRRRCARRCCRRRIRCPRCARRCRCCARPSTRCGPRSPTAAGGRS